MKSRWAFLIVAVAAITCACSPGPYDDWVEGGLYSFLGSPGEPYAVAKVLELDGACVHIRVYSNRYRIRPTEIDASTLYIASISDESEWIGITHFPLQPELFAAWQPRYIKTVTVEPNELEEYDDWALRGGECL